jgi:hypothetical protein
MKNKFFLALSAFILVSYIANAQINYGPRLGLSFTKTNYNLQEVDEEYFLKRPQIGGFVNIQLSDLFHLQANLLLNFKGSGVNFEESHGYWVGTLYVIQSSKSFDSKKKLTYLDVPLWLMIKPKISENIRLNIILGGYAGIGLAGKFISTTTTTVNSKSETITVKTKYKWGNKSGTDFQRKGDVGANLGFGVDINRLQVCAIGSYSLLDLNPQDGLKKTNSYYSQYNLMITASVAYCFGK